MAGGFHIPSFMVESQKSGRELVAWVRDIWGGEKVETVGQVKLAGWLMADPVARPRLAEAIGADLSALLAGKAVPGHRLCMALGELTDYAIAPDEWTKAYTGGLTDLAPVERARPGSITIVEEGCEPPPSPREPARVRGTLGQTEGGPLFSCDRVAPNRLLLASSMGWTIGLDRAGATAALEALAGALGVTLPERRA
jgi:hypothetical protein